MIKEAIILAGGKGTRLQEVLADLPKAMAPLNGRPFLEYQLDYLDKWGINHVVISVGHLKEKIIDHFGDRYKSIAISYAREEEPLGTGGAILNSFSHIKEHAAFILNGDTYFDVNLRRVNDFRFIKETDVVIVLRYEIDAERYGLVKFDSDNRIVEFDNKPLPGTEGYINGGLYLITKEYFLSHDFPEKFSIEKDFFQKSYKEERFFGLRCFSYFRDIGVPEDYRKALDEFQRIVY